MTASPYLTAHEAIAYLKLGSQSALYRLIREHRLPCLRAGRLYRFDTREVDAWLRGHNSAIELVRARASARSAARRPSSAPPSGPPRRIAS